MTDDALALDGTGIADQYESAAASAPGKVVIMNGGGADVVLGSCSIIDAQCPLLVANEAAYTAPDGLDPSAAGSQASAAVIWATMQQSCIAQ